MVRSLHSNQSTTISVIDPAAAAVQFGYREISGDIPDTTSRLLLTCWASIYEGVSAADQHYEAIVELLGLVDGNAKPVAQVAGHTADRFGNMSERYDLLGKRATLWVTSSRADGEARGAVLAAVDENLLQTLILDPYEANRYMMAPGLLERIGAAMAVRQSALKWDPGADTMSRLPNLSDLGDMLENASIGINRYTAQP